MTKSYLKRKQVLRNENWMSATPINQILSLFWRPVYYFLLYNCIELQNTLITYTKIHVSWWSHYLPVRWPGKVVKELQKEKCRPVNLSVIFLIARVTKKLHEKVADTFQMLTSWCELVYFLIELRRRKWQNCFVPKTT